MRENMSFKNIFKREMKLATYMIICVTIVVISISYAMFFKVNENSKNQEVVAGDLTFTYENGAVITNENQMCFLPMTEEESTLYFSECGYSFSVRNTGSLKASYTIKIKAKEENQVDLSKVKVVLKKQQGETLANVFESPKVLSTITDGILVTEEMEPHQNIMYKIQIYIEEETYEEADTNKKVSFQIEGSGVVHESANPNETLATSYILKNASREELIDDETVDHNMRYVGASPNNYVRFNDELWRIIGVMNNIDDGTGKKETRLKLIRNESIGRYSWDSSANEINAGYGINEWSQSKLMRILNPSFDSDGGSLYWNRVSGTCYNSRNNVQEDCTFEEAGLKNNWKNFIEKATWNIGTTGVVYERDNVLASQFYESEKSTNSGKICSNSGLCNDTIERKTKWTGYVGLMNPSDYGYSVGNGESVTRETCLNIALSKWNENPTYCFLNSWLPSHDILWTITPVSIDSHSTKAYAIYDGKVESQNDVYGSFNIFPVIYLKTNIKIVDGNGTKEKPYILKL